MSSTSSTHPHLAKPACIGWILASLIFASGLPAQAGSSGRVLDGKLHHLGDSDLPAWSDLAPASPESTELAIAFDGRANAGEFVLQVDHRDVDNVWRILLNGQPFAVLATGKAMQTKRYVIPPGALVDGKNELKFEPTKTTDDILIGKVVLHEQSLRALLRLQVVEIRTIDPGGQPVPTRVTVSDPSENDALVPIHYGQGEQLAIRPGVVYTGNGTARFELAPGTYDVWGCKGIEWGVAKQALVVPTGKAGSQRIEPITLTMQREVATPGFVACDTHIHTLTFSGHGDSSLEERMITLAAEGVELPIATDHNHTTNYGPAQQKLGLSRYFTPVSGNEVTTKVGHFNAFPLDPEAPVPNHKIQDWLKLDAEIRGKGAKVIVLNHPRWPQRATGPFGVFELDRFTGAIPGQGGVPWDAMELVNSTTEARDPYYLFEDWFALLNHGYGIRAAGTSDSHTVGDPVGQGRTYVRSSTDVPSQIDIDEACAAFRRGDTTISYGIYVDLTVNRDFHMGQVVPTATGVDVALRVAAPSWVVPRSVRLYLNGFVAEERALAADPGQPHDQILNFQLPPPPHDAHLVCVVVGDPVKGPFWPQLNRYTSAATNPVFLDADGDGRYDAPAAQAAALLRQHRGAGSLTALRSALAGVDDSVGLQVLEQFGRALRAALPEPRPAVPPALRELVDPVPGEAIRPAFARYLDALEARKAAKEAKSRREAMTREAARRRKD